MTRDADGEFGFDFETGTYDLTGEWSEAAQLNAELIRTGVHAPLMETEEAAAAFGDPTIWPAATGQLQCN